MTTRTLSFRLAATVLLAWSISSALMADGLTARLLDVDMNAGLASFEACRDQGFLVIAMYTDEAALTGLVGADLTPTLFYFT